MTSAPERMATVTIDGVDIAARFSTNGFCEVEGEFGGQSLEKIGEAMQRGVASFSAVRAVFRAALLHARPDMTPVQAGRVLQELGTDNSAKVIQAAFDAWKAGATAAPPTIPEADAQGRIAFEVGGVRYVLAFAFNAMAEIEPVFPGMSMTQIAAELLGGGVSVVRLRAMFRAALIDHRELSLWDAGDTMDAIGIATVSEAVGKAFLSAFPKVPEIDGDQEGGEGNRDTRRAAASANKKNPTKPRPRRVGTGKP